MNAEGLLQPVRDRWMDVAKRLLVVSTSTLDVVRRSASDDLATLERIVARLKSNVEKLESVKTSGPDDVIVQVYQQIVDDAKAVSLYADKFDEGDSNASTYSRRSIRFASDNEH